MTTTPSTNDSGLNLDHLEALARAATPGRWMRLFGERTVYDRMEDGCRGNAIVRADLGYGPQDISNLDFIAAANPAAVLELIDLARGATQPAAAPTHCDPAEGFCAACREQERAAQAPTVPATLPDAAALMYNALNDAYQSSVFDGEELRQVVRALAAYNRSRSGPAALAHQPAQERAERGQTLEAPLEAAPHISSAQQEPVAAPQQAPHGHLSGEQVFELAAPYFAWNASSWRESTQGTIVMTSLLGFADALLKAGPAPEQAEALEPDDAIGFRRWSKEPEMMESWVASQQAAAPDVERSVEYIMSAVASYADTKEASTLERIRRMVAEGEQARTVQQAAAPGALAIEAAKLAPILRSMCEGGDVHGEGVDIYADEYIAGDGDTYVVRAAALLEQVAAAPAGPFINEGTSAPGTPEAPQTAAARDVLAERQRQVEQEGWTLERDDQYVDGQLASAAIAYVQVYTPYLVPHSWPWSTHWFKPADDRRNLVKAGALLLAEIERLDRAAQLDGGQEGSGHASS